MVDRCLFDRKVQIKDWNWVDRKRKMTFKITRLMIVNQTMQCAIPPL